MKEHASGTPPSLARTLEMTAVRESTILDFSVEIAQPQTPPNTAATVAAVNDSRRLFFRPIDREPELRAAKFSALSADEPRSGPGTSTEVVTIPQIGMTKKAMMTTVSGASAPQAGDTVRRRR